LYRKFEIKLEKCRTPNKQFAKIAALTSLENICYFCRWLLVGKCCESRDFGKLPERWLQVGDSEVHKIEIYII